MSSNRRILVFRFSALGDVAMTIPVLWSLKEQHPNCYILFVSRPFAHDLLEPIEGIDFFPVDFKNEYKGIRGIIKLYIKLKKLGSWDFVADLHNVMRTKILSFLFRITGVKTASVNKGRQQKKALTRKKNKKFTPLKRTSDRYSDVFKKGGYSFNLLPFPGKTIYAKYPQTLHKALLKPVKKIGIAPFAKHQWKTWPEDKMLNLIKSLDKKGMQIFLFGGKGYEKEKMDAWSSELNNVHNLAGILSMGNELKVMSQLDIMVSMDSANMHLASLVEIPVVSIWGATHPYAGFYGWGQDSKNAVQINLPCRPCSVFGNIKCHRNDFACMINISEEMVINSIEKILKK